MHSATRVCCTRLQHQISLSKLWRNRTAQLSKTCRTLPYASFSVSGVLQPAVHVTMKGDPLHTTALRTRPGPQGDSGGRTVAAHNLRGLGPGANPVLTLSHHTGQDPACQLPRQWQIPWKGMSFTTHGKRRSSRRMTACVNVCS